MKDLPKGLASSGALEIDKNLKVISGGSVLDVATDRGDFIQTLMKTLEDYNSFIGVDISEKALEKAKKNFKEQPVEFLSMNAENLEFENDSFDTVGISHSLHHLSNIKTVLTEMKRVLKPNGYFLIQEMYCDGVQTEAQQTDILQHHWGAKIDNLLGIPHNKTLPKQELLEIINTLGLKDLITIESTHYVKCLYCEDKFECENPKNESLINFALKEIDSDLTRLVKLENHPDFKKLKEEGKELKKRLSKTGTSTSSHLFAIGRK